MLPTPNHPIARGVKPFHLHEEFYYNLRFDPEDKAFVPLLEAPAVKGRAPDGNIVAWARQRPNGGRGFGTTCGHFYDNWMNPDFRKFILNAIVWSAGLEVPASGVEAKFYDHDEIMAALDRSMGRSALPETYEEPATPIAELTPAKGLPEARAISKSGNGRTERRRAAGSRPSTRSMRQTFLNSRSPGRISRRTGLGTFSATRSSSMG